MSVKHIMYTAIKNVRSYSSSTDRRSQQPSESLEKSLTANRTCDCVCFTACTSVRLYLPLTYGEKSKQKLIFDLLSGQKCVTGCM